jgi:hypothetical protein
VARGDVGPDAGFECLARRAHRVVDVGSLARGDMCEPAAVDRASFLERLA